MGYTINIHGGNMNTLERFFNYIKFDTQSSTTSNTSPSTEKQKKLAEYLVNELHGLIMRIWINTVMFMLI